MRKANESPEGASVTPGTAGSTARRPRRARGGASDAESSGLARRAPKPRAEAAKEPARTASPAKAKAPSRAAKKKTATARPRERPAIPARAPLAEELLKRAMDAKTPRARALWARRGLTSPPRIDRTTRSMLLRQLYLAYYETRRFEQALEVSRQNLELEVLPDVVHQDAARAAQALGEIDAAASHLRLAARVAPVRRRAFHWWTLGSVYFLAQRYGEAVSALSRAARWGTTDKPLYQGHLAMARLADGEAVPDLSTLVEKLAAVPAGQGYGRFVLGHLAFHGQRWGEARRYLEAFVKRSATGRAALAIALDGEVALARKTLAQLEEREIQKG